MYVTTVRFIGSYNDLYLYKGKSSVEAKKCAKDFAKLNCKDVDVIKSSRDRIVYVGKTDIPLVLIHIEVRKEE